MTVIIENVLIRNIPRGKLSYYCQNCIYDSKCGLNYSDYELSCWLDGGMHGLTLTSSNLSQKSSDYFTEGYMVMGHTIRQIAKHDNNTITIKYPIAPNELKNTFKVYARRILSDGALSPSAAFKKKDLGIQIIFLVYHTRSHMMLIIILSAIGCHIGLMVI